MTTEGQQCDDRGTIVCLQRDNSVTTKGQQYDDEGMTARRRQKEDILTTI